MIQQYQYTVSTLGDRRIPPYWAYRFYSWLLEQVSDEYGEILHAQGEKPITQFLYFDKEKMQNVWTVNLLTSEAVTVFQPALVSTARVLLNTETLNIQQKSFIQFDNPEELLRESNNLQDRPRQNKMNFLSTTAFKQDGAYTIFPQVRLILQSLINKWNLCCPEFPMEDKDAFQLLEQGLSITDYSLHSSRFPLKTVKIPGFCGSITLTSRLSAPMEELWRLLLIFSNFAGIGIKTTLGMGGISLIL